MSKSGPQSSYYQFLEGIHKRYQWFGGAYPISKSGSVQLTSVAEVPVTMQYNTDNGHYDSIFKPLKSGQYDLYLKLCVKDEEYDECRLFLGGDKNTLSFPFRVQTIPDVTFASNSKMLSTGECEGPKGIIMCPPLTDIVAGQTQTFLIQSYDFHHNIRETGGDQWSIVIRHQTVEDYFIIGEIEDFSNGTYKGYFTPTKAGLSILSLTLNGQHAVDSPLQMFVQHGELDGPSSVVTTKNM